jgi:centriolar protein POC1
MSSSTLIPAKSSLAVMIGKSKFGKTLCNPFFYFSNGKNKTVKAHSGPVLKISLSQQEDFIVSCSSDKTIKMWGMDGKFKQSFLGHTNWVRECEISYDERLILSCSDDRSVKLWDINKAVVTANFT